MHVYPNYYKKKIHNYIYKKNYPTNTKNFFVLLNIRMINLSFDELRLIAQIRNISDYENKSKEYLIKALSKPETKPEIKPKQTPKPKPKPEPESKPEIRVNKRKLKKLKKRF